MTNVFVWTVSDVLGLLSLGIITALFLLVWATDKWTEWRNKK